MSEANRPRCAGVTKSGNRCKNYPLDGKAYCRLHLPESEQEISSEREQRLRDELVQELDALVVRLQTLHPDYEPPLFSPEGMLNLLRGILPGVPVRFRLGMFERFRDKINEDWFDIQTWKGIWYMLNYSAQYQADFVKRRLRGEYETDEWGLDWEFVEVIRPFFEFLYDKYWRVESSGFENIPDMGRALLVSNHSGQLPWDGAMVTTSLYSEHPAQRLARTLYATWFSTLPFLSTIFERAGQVVATFENGVRLLEQEELVAVFPEGYKGVGKLFKDRYKLARFGRGGFVKMALITRAPMIPVSVVGAEETYVSLYKSSLLGKLTGFPYFPMMLRFPWFGPLGLIPLPTKWYIDFGEPIPTDIYEPEAANNLVLVSQLSDQVRSSIQEMICQRLDQRRSVFFSEYN